MRRLTFFFKPGWIALAAVVALFAYMCFSVLAPWQLGKNSTTEDRNDRISASLDADPAPAGELLAGGSVTPDDDWRRVTLFGTYESGKDVLVRLRSVDDTPSYEVLTPFRTDAGFSIVVNRGYVLPIDGNRPPPIADPPSTAVTLDGRLRVDESAVAGRDPLPASGSDPPQVYTITAAQVDTVTGAATIDGYVQLSDAQPGGLGTIALPQLDAGPYLSYGLQWLAFGLMAPLALAYFVRAEIMERRKPPGDDAAAGPPDPVDEPDDAAPVRDDLDDLLVSKRSLRKQARTAPTVDAAQARLADRYGKGR